MAAKADASDDDGDDFDFSHYEKEEKTFAVCTDSMPHVVHHGWLRKRGAKVANWKRRYFVLYANSNEVASSSRLVVEN